MGINMVMFSTFMGIWMTMFSRARLSAANGQRHAAYLAVSPSKKSSSIKIRMKQARRRKEKELELDCGRKQGKKREKERELTKNLNGYFPAKTSLVASVCNNSMLFSLLTI